MSRLGFIYMFKLLRRITYYYVVEDLLENLGEMILQYLNLYSSYRSNKDYMEMTIAITRFQRIN